MLHWAVDDVGQLISSFLALSPEEQKDVLEMATPAIDADLDKVEDPRARGEILEAQRERESARHTLAEELAKAYVPNPRLLELIEAVLYRADCNAHAFQAREVGLFPLAALANHSCDPTCGHSTRVNGEMRFYASRPIAKGEEISISYLDDLWATPVEERRRTLMLQKLFHCGCARCTGPERCRGLRCVALAKEMSEEKMAARLKTEAELSAKVETLIGSAPIMPPPSSAPEKAAVDKADKIALAKAYEEVQALLAEVREELSPSHYLGPRLLKALLGAPGLEPMMLASVSAQALAWLECAAAGCVSKACGRAGVTRHEPACELVGDAATAVLAACRVGSTSKELVAIGAVVASRYLPWAVRQFGNEDRAVKAMRALLDNVSPPTTKNGSSGTAPSSTSRPAGQRLAAKAARTTREDGASV